MKTFDLLKILRAFALQETLKEFVQVICLFLLLLSNPLSATTDESDVASPENTRKGNRGFQVPGIGLCLIDKACIVSHDEFMVFQLSLITSRAPGLVGLQIAPFYNVSFGRAGLQLAAFNKAHTGSTIQLGMVNKIDGSGAFALLELGLVNVYNTRQNDWVYGMQIAGLLNNHEKGNGEGPNVAGLQFSGGFNSAKTVIGLQVGLDLHWIVAWLWDDPKKYISSADSVYGLQLGLAVSKIDTQLMGMQIVPGVAMAGSVAGLQLAIGGSIADGDFYGMQASVISSATGKDFYGMQISLLNSVKGNMYGLQAGISNQVEEKAYGLQIGVVNNSGGGGGFLQLGIVNGIKGDFGVLQLGLVNNQENGTLYGTQIGLWNSANRINGVQFGFVNNQNQNAGLQAGLINIANNSTGIQFGLFNYSKEKAFLQIGLINVAMKNSLKVLPFINVDMDDEK